MAQPEARFEGTVHLMKIYSVAVRDLVGNVHKWQTVEAADEESACDEIDTLRFVPLFARLIPEPEEPELVLF